MTLAFVIGGGGVGKTTLIDAYEQKSNKKPSTRRIKEVAREYMERVGISLDDLKDGQKFWNLQIAIIQEQLKCEEALEGEHSISDRSVVDALAYAAMIKPELFPILQNAECDSPRTSTDEIIDVLFGPLLRSWDPFMEKLTKMVGRYRRSLIVLLHPFGNAEDDGVRYTMNEDELSTYTDICRQILSLLGIPFLEIRETELGARIDLFDQAFRKFLLPSPLSSLSHYANITSSKKVDRNAEARHYHGMNLPFYIKDKKGTTGTEPMVPSISLSLSEMQQRFLQPEVGKIRRFCVQNDVKRMFRLEFQMDVPPKIVVLILQKGVFIQGNEYHFLGCSSGDLKMRACYVWRGTALDAEATRESNGEFFALGPVSKQIARFGLLLSAVVPTSVVPSTVIMEPDVLSSSGGNFTDGCGTVSHDLAVVLYRSSKEVLRRKSDTVKRLPSVFQIRFRGCKGVIAINSLLPPDTIVLRPSMEKFVTTRYAELALCEHSRPFSYGNLNRQFIMLLSGLGVADEVFLKVQEEHFDRIQRMLSDDDAALMLLEWYGRGHEVIDSAANNGRGADVLRYEYLRPLQRQLTLDSTRLRVLIPKSRTLFGVAETPRFNEKRTDRLKGLLRPGECMVRLTMRGGKEFSLQGDVIVSKNPCYLLGDIRVLRAVSSAERPELKQHEKDLIDCIVFPIEGIRPHSEEIAGSDLDGDQYFVCWDKRLLPPRTAPPYTYPAFKSKVKPKTKEENESSLVEYFSLQSIVSSNMGKVDSLFRAWADLKGVDSVECERLGKLFARVVDSAKSGERIEIPKALIIPKKQRLEPSVDSKFVWQRMEYAAQIFQQEREHEVPRDWNLSQDSYADAGYKFLLDFVSRKDLTMSEFTKFRLIMLYFDGDTKAYLESDFSQYVNFALFSADERGLVVDKYGLKPIIVQNALLCHSRIVGSRHRFLETYHLQGPVPWNFFWRSGGSSSAVDFPGILGHALRGNTDAMLLIQAPDGVVVALRFSRPVLGAKAKQTFLSIDSETLGCAGKGLFEIFQSVQAYLISGHFGILEKHNVVDDSYAIDLSASGLQIYRGVHSRTFVHLKIAEPPLGSIMKMNAQRGEDLAVLMSVDLSRFKSDIYVGMKPHPPVRKTPISSMELFVYNRRSDISDLPSRGISYLDVLVEESFSCGKNYREETEQYMLTNIKEMDNLIPTGEVIMELVDQLWSDQTAAQNSCKFLERIKMLLQACSQSYCFCSKVHEKVQEQIYLLAELMFTEILPSVETSGTLVLLIMDVFALLADLGLDVDLLRPATGRIACPHEALSVFIECLRRWDVWALLATSRKCNSIFEWLKANVEPKELNPLHHFVFKNGCEQAHALLSELLDSMRSRATSSVDRVTNLRLDLVQPAINEFDETERPSNVEGETTSMHSENLPTITLYRNDSMAQRLAFTVGEYVLLYLQTSQFEQDISSKESQHSLGPENYESDFPPLPSKRNSNSTRPSESERTSRRFVGKPAGYCIGRVVNLCEAPFSISIKLVAPSYGEERTPEVLRKCLDSQPTAYWEIASVPANVVTHMRNMDAIRAFLDEPDGGYSVAPDILPYLLAEAPVRSRTEPLLGNGGSVRKQELNARQGEALERMMNEPVSLVHGPGGTGKTTVAVQMMLSILEQSKHRILVCAETNLAVDNLALRFVQEGGSNYYPIRIGRPSEESKDSAIVEIVLERLVRQRAKIKPGRPFFLGRHKKTIVQLLADSRIVFATCAGTGDPVLYGQVFESVLMDEASMTTEPGALCPLVHGCRHLVMIGDHKQLGPHASNGSSQSLFERLTERSGVQIPAPGTFLNEQHRMHPALCDFPSRMFYGSELLTAHGVESLRTPPMAFFGGKHPVRFVDVPDGREERIGSGSWFNNDEISKVVELLHTLLADETLDASQITVLTFYRAQQMKLRERLSYWNKPAPEVCSVDGYQGKENQVIVASTVRSRSHLGFCQDERRLNVLFTRAKRGLIVVGRRETLKESPLWTKWLDQAR